MAKKRSKLRPSRRDAGCHLDLAAASRVTGYNRQSLEEARRNLIASKVLIEGEGGKVRINVRIEEWIFPETSRPRLTPEQIELCRLRPGEGGADGR